MVLENILSEAVMKKPASSRESRRFMAKLDMSKVIRMGLNEHPYGMSPRTLEVIQNMDDSSNLYGDFGSRTLKNAIADFYGFGAENVEIGVGSSSMINLVGTLFLNKGDEVLMCPTFAAFLDMAGINQATPVIVPLNEDKTYDLDGLLEAITEKTKMIVICNPNNPTGTYKGKKELIEFIDKVPDDIVIIMDEAYIEFASAPDCQSMYPLIKERPDKPIVVLKTFSKFYAMAGVRIGYALASEPIIKAMGTCPSPSVSRAGQMGAVQALKDYDYYDDVRGKIIEGREYLEKELEKIGCTVYRSQTNFIMFDPHRDCVELRTEILNRGILIGTPMLCRVSVGTMYQNKLFIKHMKEVMKTAS